MLIISARQFSKLKVAAQAEFRRSLMPWLRTYADRSRGLNDADLLEFIELQERRAAKHGLVTKRQIAKWCLLALITREDFDSLPPITQMLDDPYYGPEPADRLDLLMVLLARAADWQPPTTGGECREP